ncbi:hypothetical protein GCM10009827_017450 [Dactylosporangium maewongense]|uniref:DUF1963 domain-containing protein n=1 Tax=Dactylosporangium maewongense TaxID=634393 RepID=A0ABN1ZU27_9ACTN
MHLFESLIEPAAALTVIPEAAATRSHRYGGLPGLPHGTDWPTHHGTPMVLLARLDCADLAAVLPDTWTLPRTGELLFFHAEPPAAARFGSSSTADRFRDSSMADRFGDGQPFPRNDSATGPQRFFRDESSAAGRSGDAQPSTAYRFKNPPPSSRDEPSADRFVDARPLPGEERSTADRFEDLRPLLRDGSSTAAEGQFGDALDDGCRVLHVPAGLPPRPAPSGTWVVPPLCLAADRVGSVPPYDAPALAHVFALDPVAAMTAREHAEDTAGRPPRHQVLGWQRDAFLHLPGLRPLLQLEAEPGTAWGEVVNVSFWLPEADLATGRLTAARRYLEIA